MIRKDKNEKEDDNDKDIKDIRLHKIASRPKPPLRFARAPDIQPLTAVAVCGGLRTRGMAADGVQTPGCVNIKALRACRDHGLA